MTATRSAPSYWRYLKLVVERFRARGLLAGLFALLAFCATLGVVASDSAKPGSWASLFTLLSAIFAVLAVVRESMKPQFDEHYSLAYALAHGYVNNFARHAIGDLASQSPDGLFLIFRPEGLDQLEDESVEMFKRKIASKGYKSSVRRLQAQGKRVRDVLVVERLEAASGPLRYVDFPSTLLTLKSLVDYRSEQRKRKSGLALTDKEQRLITAELIDKFFDEVVQMLAADVAQGRVVFIDTRMVHL